MKIGTYNYILGIFLIIFSIVMMNFIYSLIGVFCIGMTVLANYIHKKEKERINKLSDEGKKKINEYYEKYGGIDDK